jgi:hypothetical protein
MECHIALEFDCADLESAGRNQHRPASILMACIDRRLQRGGIECNAVSFRTILANVVDPGAKIICTGIILCLPDGNASLSEAGGE